MARDEKCITSRALYLLGQPLVERLIEWRDSEHNQTQEPLGLNTIEFSTDFKEIRIVNASANEKQNIADWGNIIITALGHSTVRDKNIASIAQQCIKGEITSLEQLHLLLERSVSSFIYKLILTIIATAFIIMAIIRFF